MNRNDAREFVRLHAATEVNPALSAQEVEACLNLARVVDSEGRRITDDGYVETIWGTRAVVVCLDAKVAKVTAKTDLKADGAEISASQVIANLERLRKSWRSRMVPGSA